MRTVKPANKLIYNLFTNNSENIFNNLHNFDYEIAVSKRFFFIQITFVQHLYMICGIFLFLSIFSGKNFRYTKRV